MLRLWLRARSKCPLGFLKICLSIDPYTDYVY